MTKEDLNEEERLAYDLGECAFEDDLGALAQLGIIPEARVKFYLAGFLDAVTKKILTR